MSMKQIRSFYKQIRCYLTDNMTMTFESHLSLCMSTRLVWYIIFDIHNLATVLCGVNNLMEVDSFINISDGNLFLRLLSCQTLSSARKIAINVLHQEAVTKASDAQLWCFL